MDRNKVEIELLQSNPGKLVLLYQPVVWAIVRRNLSKGLIRHREQEDLVQEINKKLLERMPRIREQYNNTSKLRTYMSVIIRNICLEEFRRLNQFAEPDPPEYGIQEKTVEPVDLFLFRQEYERLQRALKLLHKDRPRLNLLLRVLYNIPIGPEDLALFRFPVSTIEEQILVDRINATQEQMKREKLEELSWVLEQLEGKPIPPDSLRKWFTGRLEEVLKLMNGDPPRCAYTADSLGLLMEHANS